MIVHDTIENIKRSNNTPFAIVLDCITKSTMLKEFSVTGFSTGYLLLDSRRVNLAINHYNSILYYTFQYKLTSIRCQIK